MLYDFALNLENFSLRWPLIKLPKFQFPIFNPSIPPWPRPQILQTSKPLPLSLSCSHINFYFQLHLLNSLFTFFFNLHRETVLRRKNNGPPIKFLIPLIYAPVLPLSMLLLTSPSSPFLSNTFFINFFFLIGIIFF